MRLLLVFALLGLVGCSEDSGTEVHCFNQRVTAPQFTSTTCPTINPTPPTTTAPAP